jgi:glycosyltransferase involved in cell wall biosynthesis
VRLRSLHLDAGRAWRGGQRQVLLLTRELRARGHEPLIVGVAGSPLVERAHTAGLATAAVRMRADWDLHSAKRVRSLIRTWKPDVVHAHDARSHAIALIALAGKREVPLVVSRRVTFAPNSIRLKYGKRVARFIAISQAVHDAMTRAGIESERIDIIHSGVPAPVVVRPRDWQTELGWPDDSLVVGIVGAMTAEKGMDAVCQIAEGLPPEVARRTRVVFLGGEERGPGRIGNVDTFHAGFLLDIYDAMAGLDLLWHPARSEGLGTSIIDALALGVPPVAFAVGGIPEIVEDGREGFLVPPGDIRRFTEAHQALLDNETRTRFAEAGRVRAALFSVERMTQNTERVYEQVLSL